MHVRVRGSAAIVLCLLLAACGDDNNTVAPSREPVVSSIGFSSTMVPGGSAARSLSAVRAGKVAVQYVAISPTADVPLRLTFGTFNGTTCTPTIVLDTPPSTTAQIATDIAAGEYCVRVDDLGGVVQVSVFSVLITLTINP
jgi:hypothetical protein